MKTAKERFWSKVDKTSNPNGCWEWTAGKIWTGYGRFRVNEKMILTHRYSYEIHNLPIPNGLHVCHTCDNPACVNPAHLFLGTHQDNMDDKVSKNRQARHTKTRGSINGQAKLSDADVLDIRSRQLSGKEYAKKYGVSKAQISRILNNTRWTHI